MYSPFQEVPCTPTLGSRVYILPRDADTPEAVVPDGFVENSQGETFSVPRTPGTPQLLTSPWTPSSRSLTRSRSQPSRLYVYNPAFTPRFVPRPAVAESPQSQVVPSCTPIGGFSVPKTPPSGIFLTPSRRSRIQPMRASDRDSCTGSPGSHGIYCADGTFIDASGDNRTASDKQKLATTAKKMIDCNNNPVLETPRSRREAVARFRRSPDVVQMTGNAGSSQDFLDFI